MNRRVFMKTSGAGFAAAVSSSFLNSPPLTANQEPDNPSMMFETRFGVTPEDMNKLLEIALSKGGDFSELFFEYRIANTVSMEEDIIRDSSERITLGVGIRVLKGDQTGYAYTNDLVFDTMKQAALTSAAIASLPGRTKAVGLKVQIPGIQVYDLRSPLSEQSLDIKIGLVKAACHSALTHDSRITKVESQLQDEMRYVTIANSQGLIISDARPQVRLFASATAEDGQKRNTGISNAGGRIGLDFFSTQKTPESIGRQAAEEALLLLSAINPPAGDQPVVLGARQSGVMIHEAVGHPLEADANRKKTSIMWDKMGQKVASDLVTIYDDPTIPHFRGSLNVDDEGVIPEKTMLIAKGKLVGFLQDRLSARSMHMNPNGHGRRQSFQDIPIPRMANTILAPGESDPEDIIRSVKKGFYAETYQGGMVQDSGKFTFSVNLGYMIEDGRLTQPIKNATLIGTNVQILTEVEMIGNDMDYFLGTCGKDGQRVPVTAGTPTLKLREMTVGGTA